MSYFASKEAAGFGFKDILYEKKDMGGAHHDQPARVVQLLHDDTLRELITAIDDASNDDKVGVIVLTGAGDKAFCTGGDVKEYAGVYTKQPARLLQVHGALRQVHREHPAQRQGHDRADQRDRGRRRQRDAAGLRPRGDGRRHLPRPGGDERGQRGLRRRHAVAVDPRRRPPGARDALPQPAHPRRARRSSGGS